MIKKIGNIVADIFVVVLLIFSITLTICSLTSLKSEAKLPNLFGKAILAVQTDSMACESGFDAGDLIVVDLLSSEEANNLKVNDVISFWRSEKESGEKYLETHRIVKNTIEGDEPQVEDGILTKKGVKYYVTKGDNTTDIDYLEVDGGLAPEYASASNIVAVWTGIVIPNFGSVMSFLQGQTGFFCCIILPLLAFFLFELYQFISTLSAKKKKEALEAVAENEDAIKQKAIEEYLAQQQQNQQQKQEQIPKDNE